MKKTLSIFIALVMMLSLAVLGISAATGEVQEGYTPATGSVGIKSLSEITDPAGIYHLTEDITVNETFTTAFSGVLDGCGHTVTVSAPMFEILDGTVKNMVLEGSITANNQSAAAVALESTAGMTAQNITSNVDITVTGDVANLWAAAIVCDVSSIVVDSTFANIVNNGKISAVSTADEKPRAAGIADIVERGTFTDCVNNGEIYSSGTVSALSAGICARPALDSAGVGCSVTFNHCVNNGKVSALGSSADAGGIAGYSGHKGNDGAVFEFINCVNTGDITAVYRAGGLTPYVYANAKQYARAVKCINTGTVKFGGNIDENGVLGDRYGSPFIAYTNSANTVIDSCIDLGKLVCIDEGYESYALITSGATKIDVSKFNSVYVVDTARFDYFAFSTKAANYIAVAAATGVINTTGDYIKSDEFIAANSGFYKTEGLPVVAEGDSWNGNEYVIYVDSHICVHDHYEAVDATNHNSVCSCGKIIETIEHNWSNKDGKCTDCDYICEHTGGYSRGPGSNKNKGDYNTGLQFYSSNIICGICKYIIAEDEAGTIVSETVVPGTCTEPAYKTYVIQWPEYKDAKGEILTQNIPKGWGSGRFTGEIDPDNHTFDKETHLCVCGATEPTGWVCIDEAWYYVFADYTKATGIVRIPYPTVPINGITYAPNAEDLQYVLDHPEVYYSDAETALFIFDEDGKFVADTGFVTYEGATRYAADGMIGWHPGLVEIDGEYYYFLGDSNGCGNVMMTGDVYVTRNTTDLEVYYSGIYTFAEDGKLCRYEGLTKIGDKLYYYDGYCRSKTVGAVEVEPGKYIYVRTTNCEVIVGRSYWVTATGSSNLVKGAYTFDENGYITNPVVKNTEATDGIFDGYYYENGEISYGKGAVEIDGDIYFVTASGKIAVGEYWVTQSSEILPAGKYTFGEDGKLLK